MEEHIARGSIKVIELVGVSPEGFDDAIRQAVRGAAAEIDGITGVEVLRLTGKVDRGDVTEFHANVRVAFVAKGLML